jgi:hypothetical protein
MDMKQNVGKMDKMVRVIAGVVLVILGLSLEGMSWLGFVGLVPLVTAALGYCPAYCLLGKDTMNCCGGGSFCKPEGSCSSESTAEKKQDSCCGGGKCSE